MTKKVFVSGCYDLLHSGHVAFFREASIYGDLYVGIGSDQTINELKGRPTVNSEQERLYMVKAVRYVKDAFVNSGGGIMDFEKDLRNLKPDVFVVNEDGYSPSKLALCKEMGIELKVLERIPDAGLPARSTTAIRSSGVCMLPYGSILQEHGLTSLMFQNTGRDGQ
jgi:cytidyltransferase-like protein